MILQNLHAHTTYDDGKSTAEEMILGAIAQGCTSLGFSGHSPLPWGSDGWAMPAERVADFRREVLTLREKYREQLEVFLGLEQDLDSPRQEGEWDYLIGSVHSIWAGGTHHPVDYTAEATGRTIAEHFGGDAYAYAECYFQRVATVVEKTGCQIVGHFDLTAKFNESSHFFEEEHPRYLTAAMDALDVLAKRDPIFEINTGAISRGYRSIPYPAPVFLRRLRELKCRVCFSGDTHHCSNVIYAYDAARQLALDCGYSEIWVLTRDGFVPQTIS